MTGKLSKEQTVVRKAASIARLAGFEVIISDSNTTDSSYLYVGFLNRRGGFDTLCTLRVSDHRKPGFSRGGWIMNRNYFDLRPRSRRYDMVRVRKFVDRALSTFDSQ